MAKYRQKPVIVTAEQFRERYCKAMGIDALPACVVRRWWRGGWWIDTWKGWARVRAGDWIITGVKGEQYPCEPDIFELTYEPVSEEPSDAETQK